MRDPSASAKRRDEMAKAAAPFLHSKLTSIENPGPQDKSRVTGIELSFVIPKRRPDDAVGDNADIASTSHSPGGSLTRG
jgi:hypothetical protein